MGLSCQAHQGIWRQHVEELTGDVPAAHIVPQRALEIVTSIQIYRIQVLLLLLETFNGGHNATIAADARCQVVASAAINICGLESSKKQGPNKCRLIAIKI